MPVNNSGRIIKTKRVKKGTPHQKNHRWESFTTKISKLSALDPIRRVRRHDIDPEDLSTTTSYLKAGLEKWRDLNMSDMFGSFSRDISQMCDSLPQIIHFEDKIMETFVTYMEKKEKSALEPLLELMTDFAHDLGARFERHYPKALELVTSIAGTPQDVEVIEWSFTCLAFLFKYLSKLLVQDLRPTYDLMAPLLGKHRQRPHIARFAAEAMSFLLKKAGAPAHREKALPLIVNHAKQDLESIQDTREFGLYFHGLMTLFAEAMKGNGLTVHTSGPAIFQCLVNSLSEEDLALKEPSAWSNVVSGVLTSILHHTSSDTFKEMLDLIVIQVLSSFAQSSESSLSSIKRSEFFAKMIGIIAGVRKGSRINDWPSVLKSMSYILQFYSKKSSITHRQSDGDNIWNTIMLSVAIVIQYSPMDALITFISPFMEALTKDPFASHFLTFCAFVSEGEPERFQSIVLPYFRRFVVAHWSDADNGDTLSVLLPRMVSSGALPSRYSKEGFSLPQSWQDQIVSKFERLEVSPFPEQSSPYNRSPTTWHDRCLPKYNALLEVLDSTVVHPSTNARIAEILLRKLKLALRPSSSLAEEEANFIVGRGFSAFSRMSKAAGEIDRTLEPLLRAAAPRYARLPNFLEAFLDYETSLKIIPTQKQESPAKDMENGGEGDLLVNSLVENLATSSHDLRMLSLRLLDYIHNTDRGSKSEALKIMLMVEQTPLDLQTARSASMHIRKLATLFASQTSTPWLQPAIVSFSFGMLTVKFAQVWEDATSSLKQIAESKAGEELVAKLGFEWLEVASVAWDGANKGVEKDNNNGLTDFECSNLMRLVQVAKSADAGVVNARDTMLKRFAEAQELVPSKPSSARAQALRVLTALPKIAERRSRQLVPMFLSWAKKHQEIKFETDDDTRTLSDWTRKDQKTQLDLFCLFTNPGSLYKSGDIHDAVMDLVANGDIEIQKSAVKVLFTWKDPNIRPYEENLLNLLDEQRFQDEITVFLHGDTLIQPEHRPILMPVLLRLLYGRSISRKGAASGRQGMEARRLTVLRSLNVADMGNFLDIALGDLKGVKVVDNGQVQEANLEGEALDVRKQVGFMHMMESMLKELATKALPHTEKLANAILYCTVIACRNLKDDPEETEEREEAAPQVSQTSMFKVVRQTGLRCLNILFTHVSDFDWAPYIELITKDIIVPRLTNLPIETAQGISAVLRLFSAWSASPKLVLYLGTNDQMLSKVAECLAPQSSKDEVKLFALQILQNVVKLCQKSAGNDNRATVRDELLGPNMDQFLIHIGSVLRGDPSKNLLESCVDTVSQLANFVTTSTQAKNLVEVSIFLLDQPSRRVSPRTKSGLLLVLENFVPLYELHKDRELKDKVYNTITSLFGFFKDRMSREVLSRVLTVYSEQDPVLAEVAKLCVDLNSFVEGRLDEPDYDRRRNAFTAIEAARVPGFTARQWTPLLFNMLFYIRHDEEFAILSTHSSDGICRFLTAAAETEDDSEKAAFFAILSSILVPALFAGAREPSEIVRREYLKVMGALVRLFHEWPEVKDMHGLLAGDDELESSFFNNILAVGVGRRSGALGQISASAEKGEINAKNIGHFFIPIIEHFIFDRAEGSDAHNLAAEATTTVAVLAKSLEWPQYRAMLRRFIGYIGSKPELEKQIIRLLGKVIDSLAACCPEPTEDDAMVIDQVEKKSTLATTVPNQQKLGDDLTSNIIPPLTTYLHDKDESTVSLRVPVAVIVVRLLKLLPEDKLKERLPAVLTDICHILRSKAQTSRDMTRDTLTKICFLLGPSCFGFVLKELRSALATGSQIHVLSYTMHSILVECIPEYMPGDLDYCLPSIVQIIMDDIFGAAGQEKDAEEYTSKMKEVKSSKSYDSMELIARTATLSRLTDIVRPIRLLLKEKLNLKMVRKIDELLNRITNGLLRNMAADSRDSLIFCYEVIQDVYNGEKPKESEPIDRKLKKYLLQKGAKRAGERGGTTVYTHKLVRFAFDVMRAVLKKYDSLRTGSNIAGFIPLLGDTIVQADDEVRIAAFKLLTTLAKVPLKNPAEGTDLYRIAAAEARKAVSSNSSTASEISQAALRLLSVILRDRLDVPVKDTAVDELLSRLKDDITEPERRHVTFNFLRAVLDSKVETAIVYDTLDYVGTVMVTNEDKDTRDLARGAYFHFLRDYPQSKKRWSKQLDFITANLTYEREGGRLSILEVIHLLLSKSSIEYVQEVARRCFLPLIFTLADESEKCRLSAGEVIKEIFKKADKERTNGFLTSLRSWVNSPKSNVVYITLQAYGFYYESQSTDDGDVSLLQERILAILKTAEDPDSDWQQIYGALGLALILVQKFPDTLLSTKSKAFWNATRAGLSFPNAWVKLSAARLTSAYFTDFARINAESGIDNMPLKGSQGLKLKGEDITDLIRRVVNMFKTPNLLQPLADEIIKNLVFLGRCAGTNELKWRSSGANDSEQEDEEEDEQDERTTLEYLFGRLSFILRREIPPPPRAPMLIPKTTSLKLVEILTSKLEPTSIAPCLQTILLPLQNLTDPSIPAPFSTDELFRTGYEALKTSSEEIMEALKKKMGTSVFTEALLKVREGVKQRRLQRTSKRKIGAVKEPEKYGEVKRRKGERKKERRKEKGFEYRSKRQEY